MARGDDPAEPATFRELYDEHGPHVLRLLRRFRVHASEREDVAQEVWNVVQRAATRYDPRRGTRRAWIAGIVRNAARDWHRTRRRRPEFAQPTDHGELADPRHSDAEADAAEARRREAILSFIERAIPSEKQRAALLFHEVDGMTMEEVANAMAANVWTVQWRIKMARRKLKAAEERLTDEERDKLRAVVLPLGGVDGLFRALRDAPVPPEEVARVWKGVSERIAREGGSVDAPLGPHGAGGHGAGPPAARPKGYTFTGIQVVGALAGVFLLGTISGAVGHALLSHDEGRLTSIEADRLPAPVRPPDPRPEPTPTASPAPSATSEAGPTARESERWIMKRARAALQRNAAVEALEQANKHASLFRNSTVAGEREEIAIRALVQLGRRPEAEARAARLLRWAPQMRPAMEALLGRSFL